MDVYRDSKVLKTVLEQKCTFLSGELCDHYASYKKSLLTVSADQTDHVRIISDTKISADLILLNVFCADRKDNLSLITEFFQKTQFTVRFKSRKYAGCMIVIKKLATKLKVELATEFSDTLADVFGLHFQIFVIVKSNFHRFLFLIIKFAELLFIVLTDRPVLNRHYFSSIL